MGCHCETLLDSSQTRVACYLLVSFHFLVFSLILNIEHNYFLVRTELSSTMLFISFFHLHILSFPGQPHLCLFLPTGYNDTQGSSRPLKHQCVEQWVASEDTRCSAFLQTHNTDL